ncbi:MAG: GNAT family N-acetyltransferase [Alphaproteobacteria bacterium]
MTAPPHISGPFALVGLRSIPFNFWLGEWRLWSASRPLFVLEHQADAQRLSLDHQDLAEADGFLLTGLPAPIDPKLIAPGKNWVARPMREYPRHLVDLTTGYEAYLAGFSAKTRSTFRRKLRKFEDLSGGKIEWREFRDRSEIDVFFPLAREVSAKSYQEQLMDAGLPDTEGFRDKARALAAAGAVRAYILFLGGKPVSYLYMPVERGAVIYAYLGYDPACAEHSPGTVLQLLAMERLFADPAVKLLDFTDGAGHHKELFATHKELCVDLLVLKRGSRADRLSRARTRFSKLEKSLAGALDRFGVRKRLKALLRRASRRTPLPKIPPSAKAKGP